MSLKKAALAGLLATSALAASLSQASETYIGASFGQSKAADALTEDDMAALYLYATGTSPTTSEAEDTDSALKVYFGTSASETIDIRFGFVSLGEFTAEATKGINRLNIAVESKGVFVDGLAKYKPNEHLALFGKLGLAYMKTEMTFSAQGSGGYAEDSLSGDNLVFAPGLGIALNLGERAGLTVEFERYLDVGDEEETGQSDIDVISAGVFVKF